MIEPLLRVMEKNRKHMIAPGTKIAYKSQSYKETTNKTHNTITLKAFKIKGEYFKLLPDIKHLLSSLPRNILRNIRKYNTT